MTEYDDIVKSVDELGPKHSFNLFAHAFLHTFIRGITIGFLEAELRFVLNRFCTGVRCHDQHNIPEIDIAAETIGQASFFHHLQ